MIASLSLQPTPAMRTILIADDNPMIRRLLGDMLFLHGYRVEYAEHGRAALARLATGQIDGMTLDLQMPIMDGWQTIRQIRSDATICNLPVVAVTSERDPSLGCSLATAGFNDVIYKPCEALNLIHALSRAFEASSTAATPRSLAIGTVMTG